MFKVNNKDTRTTPLSLSVSIVNFEHVIGDWERLNTILCTVYLEAVVTTCFTK